MVDHRGVSHKGKHYRSKALNRFVGRKGVLKFLPGDPSHVWVLVDGKHILAWHQDVVPVDEDDRLLSARRYQKQRADRLTRDAAELLNARLSEQRAAGRVLPLSAIDLPRTRTVSRDEEIAAFGGAGDYVDDTSGDEDAELEAFGP